MANSDPGSPRKSNKCLWLHDWGKWEFVKVEETATYVGVVTTQSRKCNRCGYIQTKLDTVLA